MKIVIMLLILSSINVFSAKESLLQKSINATNIIRNKQTKLNLYQKERIHKLLSDVITISNGQDVTVSDGPYNIPDVSKVLVCTSIREMVNLYTGASYKTQRPCSTVLPKINKLGVYCSEIFEAMSVMSGKKMKTQSSCQSALATMNDYGAFCSGLFVLSHAVSGVSIKTPRPCKTVLEAML